MRCRWRIPGAVLVTAVLAALAPLGTGSAPAGATTSTSGPFTSVSPARLLGSASGTGSPVAAGGTVVLSVEGEGGVPASGVSAVVLNVTVTQPTAAGQITAYADGTSRPLAWDVDFSTGQTASNLVVAAVGTDGKVDLANVSTGSIGLIIDVSGYFGSGAAAANGAFTSIPQARILDTGKGIGAPAGAVPAEGSVALSVLGQGGVPASGVSAVVLSVTVTQPTAAGHVTVYRDGARRPNTWNLNFVAGRTMSNLVVAPVATDGKVDLANVSKGTVQLIADVEGYFSGKGTTNGAFTTLQPTRLLDTLTGTGAPAGAVGVGATLSLAVDGHGGVPASDVTAVVLNVTVTQPTAAGQLTVYPDDTAIPAIPSVNFSAVQTVSELVLAPVGLDGAVDLHNASSGTVQLVADVSGYFSGPSVGTAAHAVVNDGNGTCAILATSGVDCWGPNPFGDNGDGTNTPSYAPVPVKGVDGVGLLGNVSSLATDGTGYCAVLTTGGVDCWGEGTEGELGDGSFGGSSVPVAVKGLGGTGTLQHVVALDSFDAYYDDDAYCALSSSGHVDCWGWGPYGQLGNGVYYTTGSEGSDVPVAVEGVAGSGTLGGVASIRAEGENGNTNFCAALTTGHAVCWGQGLAGQLGNGAQANSDVPVTVVGVGGSGALTGVSSLAASPATPATFCAVLSSGGADCWGSLSSYSPTTGYVDSDVPVPVLGAGGTGTLTGVAHLVTVGTDNSFCALLVDGAVTCWLTGEFPADVPGVGGTGTLTGVVSLASSNFYPCAVLSSSGVVCWSEANGTTPPVAVEGLNGVGTLSGVASLNGDIMFAANILCAVLATGGVACWGSNGYLGNGSTSLSSPWPVGVAFS